MKSIQVLTALLGALVLASCSNGGAYQTVGNQCAANYDPFSLTSIPANQKISLKDATQIPTGNYKYAGSSLYYKDNGGYMIQVDDIVQKDGVTFKMVTNCIRNASAAPKDLTFTVPTVTGMTAQNNKVTSDVTNYGFRLYPDGHRGYISQADTNNKPNLPSDVYTDQDSVLIRTSDTSFEIRSKGQTDNGSIYETSVRFTRQNLQ